MDTNTFPIKLNTYFFVKQSIEANPNFDDTKTSNIKNEVSSFLRQNDQENKYYCTVLLDINEEESDNFPYKYSIEIFGVFSIQNKSNNNLHMEMIRDQGTMLLIGAMREKIANATALGPWDKYVMDFFPIDQVQHYVSKSETEKATPSPPKKRTSNKQKSK